MTNLSIETYKPQNHIRIVTAASLFDGHDAAINIMRRIIQSTGCEVIHLGHNRSVQEIVDCAIQEDAQAIAITSYQGGHLEYFKYMYDLLKDKGASQIKIFGGGGGTIHPEEMEELHAYGITRIYSPDDGRAMGLQGMINDLVSQADFSLGHHLNGQIKKLEKRDFSAIARTITAVENFPDENRAVLDEIRKSIKEKNTAPVLGITGTGGAGKSSLVDELVRRFLHDLPSKTVAVISVDPSKRKTGGALLGDRIRMNAIFSDRVYMRSLATRQSNLALSKYVRDAIDIVKAAGFDLIILETSGIGQSDTEITEHSDLSLYVMTPEYGAASQLEKIDMLDFADVIALNKFDKRGALDALRDVKKQYIRNHNLWDAADDEVPVFGTIASQFNDPGMNQLYGTLMHLLADRTGAKLAPMGEKLPVSDILSEKTYIIPPKRTRYLSEITDTIREYNTWGEQQCHIAQNLYGLELSAALLSDQPVVLKAIEATKKNLELSLDPRNKKVMKTWQKKKENYEGSVYSYTVRGKKIEVSTTTASLSGTPIPKVALPTYKGWGD
ncbi:MAG: methylmalonyl-CoA mutase family protein, partial [Cyclobacteriaceae bacterium]|nr:methylmalonyl-CoA mutase family protein [Cyclobacteriaceae bacterium]